MPTAQPVGNADSSSLTLADVLVSLGALDKARADQIKLAEIQSGNSQEDIIKKGNLVPESKLVQAKAQLYNIPYIDLSTTPVAPAAMATLPSEVAERFKVFPVSSDKRDKTLVLAMADPMDLSAIEFIEQKTGLHVKPRAAAAAQIQDFIQNRYATTLTQEVTAALKEVAPARADVRTLERSGNGFIPEIKCKSLAFKSITFCK